MLFPVMIAHLATYGGLYALFVGAILHAATQTDSGLSTLAAVDLAASTLPITLAAARGVGGLRFESSSKR
jgi:hypothetical protein